MSKPLRRTRRDLIATGVIAGVSALLVGTAFFTAPVRQADLSPAADAQEEFGQLAVVPSSLSEATSKPRKNPTCSPTQAA